MKSTIREAVNGAFAALAPVASREASEAERMRLTADFVCRQAGGYSGKRVLDLGSSLGVHLVTAKKLGASVAVGLDKFIFPDAFANDFIVSREEMEMLERAWRSENVEIRKHDLADPLPFADGSFDLVTCHAVIEHLNGIHRQLFSEVHRVLAPGGSFVFTTPNLASLLKRVRFLIGRSPNWEVKDFFNSGTAFTGHTREFTIAECQEMLKIGGFSQIVITSKPSYFNRNWFKNPSKFQNIIFQSVSRLWATWGDLIFAVGRK